MNSGDGRVGYAPLILRPRTLGEHKVAVVLSTNTWQAYNFLDANGDGWGDSWYVGGASPTIDLRRPFLDFGVPFRFKDWDLSFISWLNRTGKQVDFLTDDDLERASSGDALRRAYDLVVFPGHEEYVSGHAYDVVSRYRDLGGDLMFLSANNFFWKVTRSGQTIRRVAMWRTLGKPEAALVGVQWAASNYGSSQAPYVVQGATASPWAFAGTGLRNGSTFGRYGIEIDTRAPSSPAGTRLLARIPNAIGSHDAEMTYYEASSGARVFAAGALNFTASITDPAVSRLVDNVWSRLGALVVARRSPGRSCGRGGPRAAARAAARGGAIRSSPSAPCSASEAWTWMSTPIRSISAQGPIGQPAPNRIARSTSSGLTRASSSTRTQSFSSGIRMRLTMKPGVSLQATGSLPSRWANANAVSKASSLVCAVRTTSTSGSTGAGLKKCMPTTRSGVCVASAICVTESAEVFVARIAARRDEAVELAEQLALDLEILEGGLDHELAVRRGRRARSSSVRRPSAASFSSWVSRSFSTPRPR